VYETFGSPRPMSPARADDVIERESGLRTLHHQRVDGIVEGCSDADVIDLEEDRNSETSAQRSTAGVRGRRKRGQWLRVLDPW